MRQDIVRIYDRSIVERVAGDEEPISELATEISDRITQEFKQRLENSNYRLLRHKDEVDEYVYDGTKSWSLKVMIGTREICFTAPRTKSFNSSLIFEVLQTAAELCDHGELAIYSPRDKQWTNQDP